MTVRDLAFRAPPSLAVAEGATTPAGGVVGAMLWSSSAGKPLVWNGSSWVAFAAAGTATVKQATLDFGAVPVYSIKVTFADAAVTTGSRIVMTPAADSDEYEMDGFECAAYCAVAGTVTAYIHARPGPVTGTRKFNYMLG